MGDEPSLTIHLTRLSNDCHVFEAVRANGSSERLELETRSFLLHDLCHFALEAEAQLTLGFYGLLASGGAYEATAEMFAGETGRIEMVIARLQTAIKGEVDPEAFVTEVTAGFENLGQSSPDWLTPAVVRGAMERLRSLRGRWKALPFGETLELTFPDP